MCGSQPAVHPCLSAELKNSYIGNKYYGVFCMRKCYAEIKWGVCVLANQCLFINLFQNGSNTCCVRDFLKIRRKWKMLIRGRLMPSQTYSSPFLWHGKCRKVMHLYGLLPSWCGISVRSINIDNSAINSIKRGIFHDITFKWFVY